MQNRDPMKVWRLAYRPLYPREQMPFMALRGGKRPQAKMGVDQKQFMAVTKDGVTIAPGLGNRVNIQGLPQSLRFGGMVTNLDFPVSLIPITPFTPFPMQRFAPPFLRLLPTIALFAGLAATLPA